MSAKIGRNDACPCGSGRKYKHCCGRAAATREAEEKVHAAAVERALDWLASRHRKAAGVAIEAMLFGGLTGLWRPRPGTYRLTGGGWAFLLASAVGSALR